MQQLPGLSIHGFQIQLGHFQGDLTSPPDMAGSAPNLAARNAPRRSRAFCSASFLPAKVSQRIKV